MLGAARPLPQREAEDGVVLERAHTDTERIRGVRTDDTHLRVAHRRQGGGAHGVFRRLDAKGGGNSDEPILSTRARVAINELAPTLVLAKDAACFVCPAILLDLLLRRCFG